MLTNEQKQDIIDNPIKHLIIEFQFNNNSKFEKKNAQLAYREIQNLIITELKKINPKTRIKSENKKISEKYLEEITNNLSKNFIGSQVEKDNKLNDENVKSLILIILNAAQEEILAAKDKSTQYEIKATSVTNKLQEALKKAMNDDKNLFKFKFKEIPVKPKAEPENKPPVVSKKMDDVVKPVAKTVASHVIPDHPVVSPQFTLKGDNVIQNIGYYAYSRDLALRNHLYSKSDDLEIILNSKDPSEVERIINKDNDRIDFFKGKNLSFNEFKTKFLEKNVTIKDDNILEQFFKNEQKVFLEAKPSSWTKNENGFKNDNLLLNIQKNSSGQPVMLLRSLSSDASEYKKDVFNMVRLIVSNKSNCKVKIKSTNPDRVLELFHQLSAAGISPEISPESLEAIRGKRQFDTVKMIESNLTAYPLIVRVMDSLLSKGLVDNKMIFENKYDLSMIRKEGAIPNNISDDYLKEAINMIRDRDLIAANVAAPADVIEPKQKPKDSSKSPFLDELKNLHDNPDDLIEFNAKAALKKLKRK